MSILYSIPIHYCPECVEQLCKGIFHFDSSAKIILHISKSEPLDFFTFKHPNILINPHQFETKWGGDFSRVHISNFLYAKKNIDFSYFVILSSNMLQLQNIKSIVESNNVGYSIPVNSDIHLSPLVDEDCKKGTAYNDALKNEMFKKMIYDLNITNIYSCVLDGTYTTKIMMELLTEIYIKYFNFNAQDSFAFEEVLFPTIICNFYKGAVHNSLLHECVNDIQTFNNIIQKNVHFAKKVERDKENEVRKYYTTLLNL
jgi:hypothetical protein